MRVAFLLPASVFTAWASARMTPQGSSSERADAWPREHLDARWRLMDVRRWTKTASGWVMGMHILRLD